MTYLPDFFSKQSGHHIGNFFSLLNSSTFINLVMPKNNLLNEVYLKTVNLFNPKDIFKIPQENLGKTATENYIKN